MRACGLKDVTQEQTMHVVEDLALQLRSQQSYMQIPAPIRL